MYVSPASALAHPARVSKSAGAQARPASPEIPTSAQGEQDFHRAWSARSVSAPCGFGVHHGDSEWRSAHALASPSLSGPSPAGICTGSVEDSLVARRAVRHDGSDEDHRGEYHDGASFRRAAVRGARVGRCGPERDDPPGVGSSVGLPSRAVGCSCATRVSPMVCREVRPCSDARCLARAPRCADRGGSRRRVVVPRGSPAFRIRPP